MPLRHRIAAWLVSLALRIAPSLTLEGLVLMSAFIRIAAVEALCAAQAKTIAAQGDTIIALQNALAAHGDTVNDKASQADVDTLKESVDSLRSDLGQPTDTAPDASATTTTAGDQAATGNGGALTGDAGGGDQTSDQVSFTR